ncbi:MAG: TIGR01244 family sulfur transferase [Woeseiaceae bacterium]
MRYQQLSNDYAVAGQISPGDVAGIADAGFKTIICNRPDGEDMGQTDFADIKSACEQHNLECYHIPMTGSNLTEDIVRGQLKAMSGSEGSVLAYCRSGDRSTVIWGFIAKMLENAAGR